MEKIELNFGRTLSDRNSIYYECVSDNDLSGDYYRASDVDALLSDVRALVDAGLAIKDQLHENATKYCCPFPCSIIDDWNKAIAAVERNWENT